MGARYFDREGRVRNPLSKGRDLDARGEKNISLIRQHDIITISPRIIE